MEFDLFIQTFPTHPTLHPAPHPGIFDPKLSSRPTLHPAPNPGIFLTLHPGLHPGIFDPKLPSANYFLKTKANNKCFNTKI